MNSIMHDTLNFNKNISVSYDGGNLSSDTGLLIPRSFDEAIGFSKLIEKFFTENPTFEHTQADVIQQLVYTTIAGYHNDDASDELREDPIFKEILGKSNLASQPTISRRINGFTLQNLENFNQVTLELFKKIYQREMPKYAILDIDSTHIDTYGNQEENAYNHHYNAKGYHPLMLFDGLTGDLFRVVLRKGSVYTSNGVVEFITPVLQWFEEYFPQIELILRGDSGFACPDLYTLLEDYNVKYVIRLKANNQLYQHFQHVEDHFYTSYGQDFTKTHALHEDFFYTASSWNKERRVVCKVERKAGELHLRHTFIVTNLKSFSGQVIKVYQKRGNMENFIKEAKLDFGMKSLSHTSFLANAAKLSIKALAYNLINFMKRLILPKEQRKSRMLSLRSILIKVASRHSRSSRYTTIRITSSYPYKKLFHSLLQKLATW
jgi:hypothetical protein